MGEVTELNRLTSETAKVAFDYLDNTYSQFCIFIKN